MERERSTRCRRARKSVLQVHTFASTRVPSHYVSLPRSRYGYIDSFFFATFSSVQKYTAVWLFPTFPPPRRPRKDSIPKQNVAPLSLPLSPSLPLNRGSTFIYGVNKARPWTLAHFVHKHTHSLVFPFRWRAVDTCREPAEVRVWAGSSFSKLLTRSSRRRFDKCSSKFNTARVFLFFLFAQKENNWDDAAAVERKLHGLYWVHCFIVSH